MWGREVLHRVASIDCSLECCQHPGPSPWNRVPQRWPAEGLRSGVLNDVFRQRPVRVVDNILIMARDVALQTDGQTHVKLTDTSRHTQVGIQS